MTKFSRVITIDGPAGSGKSTLSKKLASLLGFTYLDTGAMYRAITLQCMDRGVDLSDEDAVYREVQKVDLQIESLPEGTRVYLDGRDVSQTIRQPEVENNVHYIAKMAKARQALCELQRRFALDKQIVAEGRDMGTVVFPEASVKIFLFASIEERARRRTRDLVEMGCPVPYEQVFGEIQQRDYEDSHRKIAPLKPAEDAISLDTTGMTLDEVTEKIRQIIQEKVGCDL